MYVLSFEEVTFMIVDLHYKYKFPTSEVYSIRIGAVRLILTLHPLILSTYSHTFLSRILERNLLPRKSRTMTSAICLMKALFASLMMFSSVGGFSHSIVRHCHRIAQRPQHFSRNIGPSAMAASVESISILPDAKELDEILNVAIDAAKKAGVLIRENIGARVKYSKTNYKVGSNYCCWFLYG